MRCGSSPDAYITRATSPHTALLICTQPNRCACALWLVSLLSFCTSSPALGEEATLGKLQGTFSALLGDSNELTQVGLTCGTVLFQIF